MRGFEDRLLILSQPISLGLISHVTFPNPPTRPATGIDRRPRNDDDEGTDDCLYPCRIDQVNPVRGVSMLYAESAAVRDDLKARLEKTLKLVQESRKLFELELPFPDVYRSHLGSATCSAPYSASRPVSQTLWATLTSFGRYGRWTGPCGCWASSIRRAVVRLPRQGVSQ
jgi:hypothetical protein